MHTTEVASAKLTLHLHVVGIRSDGYHLLDSEMVSLDFADMLEFADGDGFEISGNDELPLDGNNLVVRAMQLARASAHVRLVKNIPAGAGLGGGSSDAAAVLRWAGVSDVALAAKLGADVPFCVRGGRARVTGVGDVLEPLAYMRRTFTLLTPPIGVNTAVVYRAFDENAGAQGDWSTANHLQAAAIAVEPRLSHWRDLMHEVTGAEPVLAGSGSTWFVEGEWPAPPNLDGARWTVATTVPAV